MSDKLTYEFIVIRYGMALGSGHTDETVSSKINGVTMSKHYTFHDVLNFFGGNGFRLAVGNTQRTVMIPYLSGKIEQEVTPAYYILERVKHETNTDISVLIQSITS